MRVVISAGGTGGHIYPALAIINKIKEKEPDSQFLYIGTHNRMEKDIIPKKGIPFEAIEMYGFDRKHLFKNFKTVSCLIKASKRCKNLIKKFNPDVVIGVGGYVTVPVIKAAKKLDYKTVIHEQNSIPGKANLMLSKHSDLVLVSFESSASSFKNTKVVFSGNPCSEDALNIPKATKRELGLSVTKKLVLFVMGSLGAEKINETLLKNVDMFKDKKYEVLFITGNKDYDKYKNLNLPSNFKILPFYENLSRVMKITDLIVTRAGASTLSEIISLEVPSILIPSPYVTDNHQYKNAMDLVNKDAALIIEEKDLSVVKLINMIDSVLNDESKVKTIKENLKTFKVDDSAEVIYNSIKDVLK